VDNFVGNFVAIGGLIWCVSHQIFQRASRKKISHLKQRVAFPLKILKAVDGLPAP
jgi:hypothetical protein